MKNYYREKKNCQAYLTVYLALILSVLLTLALTLIEGARSGGIRLETECVTDIGLNSIFAEYHRELFRQYNLFAIDCSYGSDYAGKENVTQHLREYLERNLSMEDVFLSGWIYRDFLGMSVKDVELTRVSIMTDNNGAVFRRQAVEVIKDDVGLALMEEVLQWMQVVDANELDTRDVSAEKQKLEGEIQQMLEYAETEGELENPTDRLEEARREGILNWVVKDPGTLSHRILDLEPLIGSRMEQEAVNRGNFSLEDASEPELLLERFLFQEYLLKYMGHYGQEDEENALLYQVEYLVAGGDSDVENLRTVANRLCLLRQVANTVYLFSDGEKCMEAEVLADALAAAVMLPEIAPLVKLIILLGWAYAESLYDVETLLAGGKIPLIKDASTWHYSMFAAFQLGDHGGTQESQGLSYEDYLRIFMMLTSQDTLTARAMNMVEADIRQTPGNTNFRLDGCYVRVEADIHIDSAYGYNYQITRQRKY